MKGRRPATIALIAVLLATSSLRISHAEAAGLSDLPQHTGSHLTAATNLSTGWDAWTSWLARILYPVPAPTVPAPVITHETTPPSTTTVLNKTIYQYLPASTSPAVTVSPKNGISETELTQKLAALQTGLQGQIDNRPIAYSDNAPTRDYGLTFNRLTVNGVTGLTDADIPDGITASNYLPLSGGTVSGNLTVTGAFSGGTLTLANASTTLLSVSGPAYFGATATSTFGTDGSLTLAHALGVPSGGTGWANVSAGSILFGNGTSALATSSNFSWDNTNSRLGIGTASPFTQLTVIPGPTTPRRISSSFVANARGIYVQGRYAYIVSTGAPNVLDIIDISNPASPILVGQGSLNATARSLYVQGRYAYIADAGTSGFEVWDVSNPASPVRVSLSTLNSSAFSIYVQGRYAYITEDASINAFEIWDISNPASPVRLSQNTLTINGRRLSVQGRYAYIVDQGTTNAFEIWDVANPASPIRVSQNTLSANGRSIYVQGRYAYLADSGTTNAFEIWDISNPAAPSFVSANNINSNTQGVYVQDRYAYFVDTDTTNGFEIWDVSNPTSPIRVSENDIGSNGNFIFVQGRNAYVSTTGILEVWDIGGAYVQQLEAGGVEAGTLSVLNNLQAVDGAFTGGLTVGQSLAVTGSGSFLSDFSTFNTMANIFNITTASSTSPVLSALGNGNVGIGVSSPQHALDVYGDCIAWMGTCINTSAPANTVSYVGTVFKFGANTSFSTASATRFIGAVNTNVSSNDVARTVVTRAGTIQNLFIKASANTFSGTITYTVQKNGVDTALTAQLTGSGVTSASDTTHSVTVASGDTVTLKMVTSAGSGTLTAPFEGSFEELVTTNVFSSQWVTNGSAISYTAGNVGIGTTTPFGKFAISLNSTDTAYPGNNAFIIASSTANATTTLFNILNTGNATLAGALTQSSDQRLKTNVQTLDASSSLAAIEALNPVTFDWVGGIFGSGDQLGFIAQDVQKLFPQLVSTTSPTALTPGGTLGLNYTGLIAPIIASIQGIAHITGDFETNLIAWLGNASNGIDQFFAGTITAKKQLCVEKSDGTPICVTGDQLNALLAGQGIQAAAEQGSATPPSDASTTVASSTPDQPASAPTAPPSSATSTPPMVPAPAAASTTPANTIPDTTSPVDATATSTP